MNFKIHISKSLKKKILKELLIDIKTGKYVFNRKTRIEAPSTPNGVTFQFPLKFGAFTHINPNGFIRNCTIGRYCAVGTNVKIGNGEHPTNWLSVNACQYIKNFHNYDNFFKNKIYRKNFKPYKHTIIGNDVWIGANVFIKDGVKIGNGAIIGANSIVTHDVEPYAIVAGAPARLIRYRFSEEIIKELEELKWWEYNITDFGEIDFDNIEKAIEQLKVVLPTLEKYNPPILDINYLVPKKKYLFGLIKKYKRNGYKETYFCGICVKKKKYNRGV